MSSPQIIEPALVRLDVGLGADKEAVITALAETVVDSGRATDRDQMISDLLAREAKSATGMPGGIAIPHCKSAAVQTPSLAFARLPEPVDFGAKDGPADLVFLIGAPDGAGKAHLKVLSTLARNLVRKEFVGALRAASTEQEAVDIILDVVAPATDSDAGAADGGGAGTGAPGTAAGAGEAAGTAPDAGSAGTDEGSDSGRDRPLSIVAVTSCPTGIAHTYMAADALTQAAEARGVAFAVEPQGSSGTTPIPRETIEAADAVIFAADVGVRDRARFAGKPLVAAGVKRGIEAPDRMIDEALAAAGDPNAQRVSAADGAEAEEGAASADGSEHWARRLQKAIMTGVSYMIPFVAAGGLLMALGFLLGGYDMAFVWQEIIGEYSLTDLPGELWYADESLVPAGTAGAEALMQSGMTLYLGSVLFAIGQAAMGFMIAVLSGFIAYGLADRPGLAPGFVGGAIAVTVDAGFLGALVTGLLAGYLVSWMTTWKTPQWLAGLMPVVIIPLIGSLVVGLSMFLLLGRPLAAVMSGLENWLNGMTGTSVIVLGVILGLMMCFDLGGPVNKAAYTFATAGLVIDNPASLQIMAAVMAAGMVPPIALSLATFVRARLFTAAEKQNGRASWLLGLSFITEGAIPFAAADPLRVIPSMMAGGAVTGALSMAFTVQSYAPHGGIFVLFAINPWWGYLIAIIAGVLVAALCVVAAKSFRRESVSAPDPAPNSDAGVAQTA